MEGGDMKANGKKPDKDAAELLGKSEGEEQECKYIC